MPLPTDFRRSTATVLRSRTTEPLRRRLGPAVSCSLILLALAGCGDSLLLPSAGEPSQIEIVGGNDQTGTVGQPLGDSLVVEVSDPAGRPVPGVEVVFLAPAGAELSPNDTVITGSDGRAKVSYTLATVSGEQTIEARAKPVVPTASLTTTFTQTAEPEVATGLVMAGGDGQTAEVRAALPYSLVVKAVDRFNNGVPGVEVSWETENGSVSPATVVTGADGRAATQFTLGQRPGVYQATATAELAGSPIPFEATGIAPPSPQLVLVTQPSATATAGASFDRQPVLQLQNAVGAPLLQADVAVTVQIASGGGSLGGSTTATSNSQGRVTFEDLAVRGRPGVRTLLFAAVDFTPATSRDIDVRSGAPDPGQSSAEVPNGTAGVATTLSVHLEDEFGTPVSGAEGAIAISVTGANPAASLSVTDEGGGSYVASYVPVKVGVDNVDVRVSGGPVPGSPFASTVVHGPPSPSTTTAQVVKSGAFFYRVDATVTTRDAQGNPIGQGGDRVEVLIDGGPVPVTDNGNGTYTSASVVTFNPNPEVAITLNGSPINGSPFRP